MSEKEPKGKEKIAFIPFKSEYYRGVKEGVKEEWTGNSSGIILRKTWKICFISTKMR